MSLIKTDIDLLSRDYSDMIDKILKCGDNITIGLEGQWGVGKSFILDKLEEEKKDSYFFIKYNAWKTDYYDEPLVSILFCVCNELNKINSNANLFKGIGDEIIDAFKESIYSLLSKLSVKYLGFDAVSSGKKIFKHFKELKKNNSIDTSFNDKLNIESALNNAREQLSILCNKINVVLLVDEIDRCNPQYSLKVLERVHHFTYQIDNMKTIIAYDENILRNSLIKFYGFDDEGKINGIGEDGKSKKVNYTELSLKKYFDIRILVNEGNPNHDFDERFYSYNNVFQSINFNFVSEEEISSFKKYVLSFSHNIRTINKIVEKAELIHNIIDDKTEFNDKVLQCVELLITAISVIYKEETFPFDKCFGNRMNPYPLEAPSLCKEHNFDHICNEFDKIVAQKVNLGGLRIKELAYDPKHITVDCFWGIIYFLTLSARNKLSYIPQNGIDLVPNGYSSILNKYRKFIEEFAYKAFLQIR